MIPAMPRHFNIAGPCVPGEHYLLPALARLPEVCPRSGAWSMRMGRLSIQIVPTWRSSVTRAPGGKSVDLLNSATGT